MSAPTPIDEIDRRILELLREDARRTISDIAAHVNLSPAPVKRRIDRLEQTGVIAGYTVQLNYDRIAPSLEAFTELRFVGNSDIEELMPRITAMPEVREFCTIAGDTDALIRIRVDDMAHLQKVIYTLRRSGRVVGTKTLMVLDRWTRTT